MLCEQVRKIVEENITECDIFAMRDRQHRVVTTPWKASTARSRPRFWSLGGIKYSEMVLKATEPALRRLCCLNVP